MDKLGGLVLAIVIVGLVWALVAGGATVLTTNGVAQIEQAKAERAQAAARQEQAVQEGATQRAQAFNLTLASITAMGLSSIQATNMASLLCVWLPVLVIGLAICWIAFRNWLNSGGG